jgi:hypothetical protein
MKYVNVQLIFPEYHPDQLEKGMYFVSMDGLVQENPYVHIYELDKIPRDQGAYIQKHGLSRGGSLQGALTGLQHKGLIYDAEHGYRLAMPLLALWLRERLS